MTSYSYQTEPRPAELGGGYRLRLFENGEEVGGGVFPLSEDEDALAAALDEASAWLASREQDRQFEAMP